MNRRLLAILVSAFLVAAGCTYLVFRVVGHRMGGTQKTTRVVAAVRDIKLGTVLTSADLTTIDIAGTLPKDAILNPKTAIGRGVLSELYQGEPILESRLAAPGSGGGLAATIPEGMRACAVKVDEVVGVAGFATPGMRVDVLISGDPPGATRMPQEWRVKTLLQDIEVLSAGTDIQRDAQGKPKQVQVVNLLVTPKQAELLSLAGNQTHIQLALRNPLDTKMATPPGASMNQLFGESTAPVPVSTGHGRVRRAPAPPRLYLVEVLNGSKRSEAKFVSREGKE